MGLNNIMTVLALLRPAMGGFVARRAVTPLVTLVILGVLAGLLTAAVLVIALMALHQALLTADISPTLSLVYTALAALALLIITLIAMGQTAKQARSALKPNGPTGIVRSFLDGWQKNR